MYSAIIQKEPVVLGQGSMYERLRRSENVELDPQIFHASLVYEEGSRRVLKSTLREYLEIGQRYGLPMIATSQTWRANAERISRSRLAGMPVNRDCVRFLLDLRAEYGSDARPIVIGGTTGPKGDGYLPDEAPPIDEAKRFHRQQILELADSGADFLIAKTLPAFGEARGIAHCMAETDLPYVLSFVVRPDGTLLDGTPIDEAIDRIDGETHRPPAHYNVNCVHASVFAAAMRATGSRNPKAARRISGLDANTSEKTPEELDGLAELDTEAPADFGRNLWSLHAEFGTTYLGGCCGSSTEHIDSLAIHACSRSASGREIQLRQRS